MQRLFGTIGVDGERTQLVQQLGACSIASADTIEPAYITCDELSVGYVARSFSIWHAPAADLHLLLDGEVLWIEGRPTHQRGTAPHELAAIADLYRRYGAGFWAHLDGNFCLIVKDGPRVQLGVDPAGTRAVYWWLSQGVLAFHSYLIDLASCYPGALTENWGGIGNFLACGAYPPGATPFNEIQHLSPGTYLSFADGQVQRGEHFHLMCVDHAPQRSRQATIDELIEILEESIGTAWRAAQQPIVPLSGGADSRYIAAEIARQADDRARVQTVTYGQFPTREGGDGVVAAQVADVLGVPNHWIESQQSTIAAAFEHAIYLSNGEADHATLYDHHHLLYRHFIERFGCASIFRGDECFGRDQRLITDRALLPTANITHLDREQHGYRDLLAHDVLQPMIDGQHSALATILDSLRSAKPTSRRDELYYQFRMRQVLAIFNRVKHADLEVYNPLLSRKVLEWASRVPDRWRGDKLLFREALRRRFPQLAPVPFATARNEVSWNQRFHHEPELATFYLQLCEAPGWLDTIGKQPVVDALATIAAHASTATRTTPAPKPARAGGRKARWKHALKQSLPGQLYREFTLEQRMAQAIPLSLKLSRLIVLHTLLGQIATRHLHNRLATSQAAPG